MQEIPGEVAKLNGIKWYLQVKKMLLLTFRQKIAAAILLALLTLGGILFYITDPLRKAREYREELPGSKLYVHVCGAVAKPGVIAIPAGSRVFEAVEKAGGALAEADLEQINLAAFVEDGEQLYLPRKGEVIAPARLYNKTGSQSVPGNRFAQNTGRHKVSASKALKPKIKASWPLDLNQATREQLELVPGIGPVMAENILAYRNTHGSFSAYEDLTKVKGIGPSKLEKFRSYLCVK